MSEEEQSLICSFCGKGIGEIRQMFVSEGYLAAICDECVRAAVEAVALRNKALREQKGAVE